jgi:hypothetical protein
MFNELVKQVKEIVFRDKKFGSVKASKNHYSVKTFDNEGNNVKVTIEQVPLGETMSSETNPLLELEQYIDTLENDSFDGWSPTEASGYMTALTSINKKIEELKLTTLPTE